MIRTMTMTRTRMDDNSNSIIFAIVTNNLNDVRNLITSNNYNNILDNNTGYTALHYAIASPNVSNDIIKYLLNFGANPKQKIKNQDFDSFDLAIRYNKRYLFEYFNKIQDDKIVVLNDTINTINNKLKKSEESTNYLLNSIDNYNKKIEKLNDEIKEKDTQIVSLKRKNEETELAFNNLLKKYKK